VGLDAPRRAAERALSYLENVEERPVFPAASSDDLRESLGDHLADDGVPPAQVIDDLADAMEPGLVSVSGGRYFGFVTGGHLPAALGADWLAAAWDQNSFSYVSSPAAAVVEEIAGRWIMEVLGLPRDASVGFVTGCQMAHVTTLAAARFEVLRRVGWDVGRAGLTGAPPISVVTGSMRHSTVDRALRLLGFGTDALLLVEADDQGRLRPDALAEAIEIDTPLITIVQAGEVNTGAFDPMEEVIAAVHARGGWVHVDGAFGLWALASPGLAHLAAGAAAADSWAFDAHKWLNVPYDSGIAACAHPAAHRAAMSYHGDYLAPTGSEYDAMDFVPDASRRARGVAVYAALRSLGRSGVAKLVDRCCHLARRLADGLSTIPGVMVLNDVVLNQVLFSAGEQTGGLLSRVQAGGETWMGGTVWEGKPAIRMSVSSWATTEADIDRAVAEIKRSAIESAGSAAPWGT
jgi:glutamate/tyrosine decarboxylase-like PLP-dependent enzyme